MKQFAALSLAVCITGSVAFAQTGGNAAVDGRLGSLGSGLAYQGRTGTYPAGNIRFSMSTTSCNPGTVNLPWLQATDVRHPYIAFMAARLDGSGNRLIQVSDRSWMKHGFYALSNAQCSTCQCASNGTYLGIGCSDTYSTSNNSSSLGPPDDVNPWTGVWTPGQSPNGGQSSTVKIPDTELGIAGSTYYYCAHYVFPSWTQNSAGGTCPIVTGSPIPQPAGSPLGLLCEPDANRTNNLASRQMNITVNTGTGSAAFSSVGAQLDGTVLQRWPGAAISSNTNGDPVSGPSDGRVYVAVKVTGPVNGKYHYEYALHNRDNKGGVGVLRIPSCSGAIVSGQGFHDVDVPVNAANDWSFADNGTELVWTAPAGNALRWNMLYNFWFDSDAAPVAGAVTLDQASIVGGVAASFTITTTVPGGLFNVNLGPGCSNGAARTLYAVGSPARASLGNATFGLESANNGAGNSSYLFYSLVNGTDAEFAPCLIHLGPDLSSAMLFTSAVANGAGVVSFPIGGVPNDPALEGITANVQAAEVIAGGALAGSVNLTNGLRVRAGSLVSNCP